MHLNNRHYLTFNISKISQLQLTRMPQSTKTFLFTFTELINIILRSISESNPKPLLIYENGEESKNIRSVIRIAFYINNSFVTHDSFKKQYTFLKDHFLLRFM